MVRATSSPRRLRTRLQSGVAVRASRPAWIVHSTGLYSATVWIQPGTRSRCMNADDRNVSGRRMKLEAAITVSSLRASRAMPLDSAASDAPSRAEATTSTASPVTPPGKLAPASRPRVITISDWITDTIASWTSRPLMRAWRATGGDQEPVDHAPVEVLDHPHAGLAAGERARHDHDPGGQVVDVGVGHEPGDVGRGLEHRPEQQQPDDRLHQDDRDPPGLAGQVAQVAHGHEPGVGQGGHTFSSVRARLRPVWRR